MDLMESANLHVIWAPKVLSPNNFTDAQNFPVMFGFLEQEVGSSALAEATKEQEVISSRVNVKKVA